MNHIYVVFYGIRQLNSYTGELGILSMHKTPEGAKRSEDYYNEMYQKASHIEEDGLYFAYTEIRDLKDQIMNIDEILKLTTDNPTWLKMVKIFQN